MNRAWLPLLLVLSCCATATSQPETVVRRYLGARTLDEALDLLAPQYVLRFGTPESPGDDKDTVAKSLTWDFALHPTHEILSLEARGNVIVATVHEENDFSRLLGFPGWTAVSTFVVDEDGHIASQMYVPRPGQPNWRTYVEEPLRWIRSNSPESLERIYPGEILVRSGESAAEWVRLLRAWRAATTSPHAVDH